MHILSLLYKALPFDFKVAISREFAISLEFAMDSSDFVAFNSESIVATLLLVLDNVD